MSRTFTREEVEQYCLAFRHIDTAIDIVCKDCHGTGIKMYANTSTYNYGIGGSACTNDICDKCWGSGAENRPFRDPRKRGINKP